MLPAVNQGPSQGPHPCSWARGCWKWGADVLAALQHMYPSVSPSVGVYGALTQEMCDGGIVARLGERIQSHQGALGRLRIGKLW